MAIAKAMSLLLLAAQGHSSPRSNTFRVVYKMVKRMYTVRTVLPNMPFWVLICNVVSGTSFQLRSAAFSKLEPVT